MFLRSYLLRAAAGGSRRRSSNPHVTKTNLSMLDIFVQLQLGISIPPNVQRGFLLQNCASELEKKGFDDPTKLAALDGKLLLQLLKDITLRQYLNCVPFTVFGFDMEFTGPPIFRADGPTEDIIELGAYSPSREKIFSCLVQPYRGRPVQDDVVRLTGISDKMIQKEGLPFPEAWGKLVEFLLTPDKEEQVEGGGVTKKSGDRRRNPDEGQAPQHILLLSHGGKLADQSLIKFTLEKTGIALPHGVVFGDTIHIIRDAHRRRPVTVDRHPPAWGLSDLVSWLNVPLTLPAHRAGNDAKMTWDVVYHTLLRYGDDTMNPKQQLVSRFFDAEAKRSMKEIKSGELQRDGKDEGENGLAEQDDPLFSLDGKKRGERGGKGGSGAEGRRSALSDVETESLLLETDFDSIFAESAIGQSSSSSNVSPSGDEEGDRATATLEEFSEETKGSSDRRQKTKPRSKKDGS